MGRFLADVSARRTVIDNKRCVVAVFRDSTTRRRREEEQVHVQKLESIRTLAAGIAHDFNNLLTSLIGNVSLAQMSLAQSHEARGMLDEPSARPLEPRRSHASCSPSPKEAPLCAGAPASSRCCVMQRPSHQWNQRALPVRSARREFGRDG